MEEEEEKKYSKRIKFSRGNVSLSNQSWKNLPVGQYRFSYNIQTIYLKLEIILDILLACENDRSIGRP